MRCAAAFCAAAAIVCTPSLANAEGPLLATLTIPMKPAPDHVLLQAGEASFEVSSSEGGKANELRYWFDTTGTACHFAAIDIADALAPVMIVHVHAGLPLVLKAQAISGISCGPLTSTFIPQERKKYVVELVRKRQGNCWLSVIERSSFEDVTDEPHMTVTRAPPVCVIRGANHDSSD